MADDRNIGDKRSGYPDASQIPEAQESPEAPQMPEGGKNPVMDAITTLQQFIVAQEEKGNPKVQAMKQALIQFLTSIGGGEGAAPAGAPPEEGVDIVSEEAPIKEKKQPVVM